MGYIVGIVVIVLAIWGANRLYVDYKTRKVFTDRQSKYKEVHQLSDQDLELFKKTMGEMKNQILGIEEATNKNKDLKKIEKSESGIKSAKEIFQELMAEPNDLTKYGDFIYKKLPSMLDACTRLNKIEETGLNSKEIRESVTSILETVTFISASITDEYERIVKEDSEEIALSKKIIDK